MRKEVENRQSFVYNKEVNALEEKEYGRFQAKRAFGWWKKVLELQEGSLGAGILKAE
ncbi:hypothetical protein HMPREF0983_02034 [Erysipelotrichaceae bacterium 3_1_53]|nr:hypothetical protein HMPREF0983_02034 [Erysipelotrichaceae bacterium 3_1_53]